ncbi:MAG: SHOCT domain-containing protein [Halobacterium sp.]
MTSESTDSDLATVVLLALGALVVVPMLFAGVGMMGGGHMMDGAWGMDGVGAASGWFLLVALLFRLLFLAALVGAGYLVYRAFTRRPSRDPALEELRTAYARGDLSDEEFEERRERLQREE